MGVIRTMLNPETRISNLERNLGAVVKAIKDLTDEQKITNVELSQFRIDFDSLHNAIPFNANLFLKPSELADLLKVSTSTITKWRNEGLFKKSSIRKVVRGKRTDYYYHRVNAVKDISTIKPIQINTGKKLLDRFA